MRIENYRPILSTVAATAKKLGVDVYLVGGIIRDTLANINFVQCDLDFTVAGEAASLAKYLAEQHQAQAKYFDQFHTAKVIFEYDWHGVTELDFVSTRAETYQQPGQLPNVRLADLSEDLERRDFTINTLACEINKLVDLPDNLSVQEFKIELQKIIIDQHGGIADLNNRLIRVLHDRSFIDDPTRIFRAARYKIRLSARLDQQTEKLILQAIKSGAMQTISKQRAEHELAIALTEMESIKVLQQIMDWGVFAALNWLKQAEEQELLVSWSKFNSFTITAKQKLELFKICLILSAAEDVIEQRSACLLVSERKLKKWKRHVAMIKQGKLKGINSLFLLWALNNQIFVDQHVLIKQELANAVI